MIVKRLLLLIPITLFVVDQSDAQVNQFTGDAVYSIPLPAIGGVSPVLSYNSNIRSDVYATNKKSPSGWVGLGWGLELGSIFAITNNTKDTTDDRYFYVGNDASSEMIPVSGNEFRLKKYQYWKIFRKVNGSGKILGWSITKNDGVIHRYGSIDTASHQFLDSNNVTNATRLSLGWGGWISSPLSRYFSSAEYIPYQWDLAEIEYLNGTYTRILYQHRKDRLEVGGNATSIYYTQESHLYKIIDRTGRYLEFELNDLFSKEYMAPVNKWHQYIYEKQFLKAVKLKTKDNSVIQSLEFGYDTGRVDGLAQVKRFLTSITTKNNVGKSIPATKFTYVGISGQQRGINDGALKTVTSRSGGVTEFTYEFKTIATPLNYTRDYTNVGSSPIESMEAVNTSGIVGSNFAAVRLKNGNLEMFRWGVSGWYKDDSFPVLSSVTAHQVTSDLVVTRTGSTTIKFIRLMEGEWRVYNATANIETDSVGSEVNILAATGNYVVLSHNKKNIPSTFQTDDSLFTLSIFKIENGAWKRTKTGPFRFITSRPLKVRPTANYFITEYVEQQNNTPVFEIFKYSNNQWSTSAAIPGYTKLVYTSPEITTSGDFFFNYDGVKWNGQEFIPFEDDWALSGLAFGDNYFVSVDQLSGEDHSYGVHTWKGDSTANYEDITPYVELRLLFYGSGGTLKNGKAAVGSDFFAMTWENNDTGKFAIVRQSSGSWRTDQIFSFYKKKASPHVNGTDIILTLDSSTVSTRYVKIFKQRDSTWYEEQQLQSISGITSSNLLFTQSANGVIADLVEKSYSDNQKTLTLFKRSLSKYHTITYKGDTAGVYVVSSVKQSDGAGSDLVTKYTYSNGVFTESGQGAKFNKVVEYPPGNIGNITSYFYNDSIPSGGDPYINVSRHGQMDGMIYQTRVYDKNNTLLKTVSNYWSLNQIDSDSLVFYSRLDSVENTENSITTKKIFEYENSNGLTKRIIDVNLKLQSDRGSNQSIVTEIAFAHSAHSTGMTQNSRNIINRPFEKKVFERSDNGSLTLVSQERTFYSQTFPFYATSTRINTGTSWLISDSTISRNSFGYVTESMNVDSVKTTSKWGNQSQTLLASFVNANNSETAYEPCEEYRNVSTYGALANGFTEYNTQGASNIYSHSTIGVSGSSQKVSLPYSPTWKTGLYLNMGTLDATVNYFIEFDYIVTEGGLEVYTSNGSTSSSQVTYSLETNPQWKHSKILWNLGAIASSWKVYFRNPWDGEESFIPSTFYIDNVRIYPVDAFCTSQTFDPATLNKISMTDENGITSVSSYDSFGRATQVKR